MSGAPSGHGHARVVIGFILTGLAFVVAGRRSIRSAPSAAPSSRHRYESRSATSSPATPAPVPDLPPASMVGSSEVNRSPSPAPVTDVPLPAVHGAGWGVAAPVAVGPTAVAGTGLMTGARPDAFDSVMSRVATLLDQASSQLAVDDRDAPTVGTEATPGAAGETGDSFDALDVASGASRFLPGNSTPAPPTVTAPTPPDSVVGALRRVGLVESLLAPVIAGLQTGRPLESLLLEAFSSLVAAPPLPRRPGCLLVVVGDGVAARRLGAALADEMGIDPAEVPFASRHHDAHAVATGALLVRSAEEAAERAPGWRRARPAVVVVDASMIGHDRLWATDLIAALRPTAVWTVVDATAKTEDITAWVDSLGGVDALALEHIDATVSPAAVFGVGVPVARIDGHPTSAARWVATVVDRVARISGCP